MAVRVRLFAAVRDAAGTGETSVPSGSLPALLDELRQRYGEPFTSRLAVCSVLVDGSATPLDAEVEVPDGAELALLPPVSGGVSWPPQRGKVAGATLRGAVPASAALGALLGAVVAGATLLGGATFGVVVVALAVAVLVDFSARLGHSGTRPIALAAAVPGVGLPAASAAGLANGWTAVPDFTVAGALAAFLVAILFRRRDATAALGRTALVGLTVGLGATGLLLLRSLPDGLRWALGAVAALSLVEVVRQVAAARASVRTAGVATVVTALVTGGVLLAVADPPFGLSSAVAVAAVALLAGGAAGVLRQALAEAGVPPTEAPARAGAAARRPRRRASRRPGRPRAGLLTDAALPLLIGTPLAYALARLAAL